MSARTQVAGGDGMKDWLAGWTIFYWAGGSAGRRSSACSAPLSRGRTIRQFVSGVLLVPSVVSLILVRDLRRRRHRPAAEPPGHCRPGVARGLALRDARQPALADRDRGRRRHAPRRDLLRVGCGRRVDRHGHALEKGQARARTKEDRWSSGARPPARRRDHALIGGEDAGRGLQNVTIVAALPFLVIMIGLASRWRRTSHAPAQAVRRSVCRRGRRARRRRGRQRAG